MKGFLKLNYLHTCDILNMRADKIILGLKFMKDEIESLPQEAEACEMKTPHDHEVMIWALSNPLRRSIVKSIGARGKTRTEIMKELDISDLQLNLQLDFLVRECYAEVEGGYYRLNEKGLQELLANIR